MPKSDRRIRALTAAERRTLHLMVHLATKWEASLIDANTPNSGYKPDDGMREVIRDCQRNIRRFARLRDRLAGVVVSK